MMSVTCPAGVAPGQMLQITSPSGAQMQVAVPAGVGHVVLPYCSEPTPQANCPRGRQTNRGRDNIGTSN